MKALKTIRNLAGGQVPPLTRTALISGFIVFFTALLVFHPQSGGMPAAPVLTSGVVLMPGNHPLTEGVVLLDTSALFLPSRRNSEIMDFPEVNQPEDNPFLKYSPNCLSPTKPIDLPLEYPKPRAVAPQDAVNLNQWEPFTTFGTKSFKEYPVVSQKGYFEVYPISGALKPIIYGKLDNFNGNFDLKNFDLSKKSPILDKIEVIIGVDSMGLHGGGSLIKSSGNRALDGAVQQWIRGVDWAQRLAPGTYRICVGP